MKEHWVGAQFTFKTLWRSRYNFAHLGYGGQDFVTKVKIAQCTCQGRRSIAVTGETLDTGESQSVDVGSSQVLPRIFSYVIDIQAHPHLIFR